jgi:hypothetical protein
MDMVLDKKVCSSCKKEKTLEYFSNHKRYKYGKSSICKSCNSERTTFYVKRKGIDKEKEKEKSRLYRLNNPETFKLSVRFSIYKKLGLSITKEEYFKLHKEQDGKCKICNNPPTGFKKTLCLDHCHSTLKVRGLLCDNCNAGLGKFKDDIELLSLAVKYLKSFQNGWTKYK